MFDKRPVHLTDQQRFARAGRNLPPVSPPAAGDKALFNRLGKVPPPRPLSDTVELGFVFDFEPEEAVVYAN